MSPNREEPFVNNEIYHVFNKTIDSKTVFHEEQYAKMFLKLLYYYRSTQSRVSFSRLKELPFELADSIMNLVDQAKYFRLEILCYCFMPTHFHLLMKQKIEGGITKCISDSLNALTKSYNAKHSRIGPVFLPRFKSVRIMSQEQLIHVSRYIHLNPYSAALISDVDKLKAYGWSSLNEYLETREKYFSNTVLILSIFKNNREKYWKFVSDNADYQKNLEFIKIRDRDN